MSDTILNDEKTGKDVYRELQKQLDELPMGFPPTKSGVEIRWLKQLFTPEEAKIASMLKFGWKDLEPLEDIYKRLKPLAYTIEELEKHLDNMAEKGSISFAKEGNKNKYSIAIFTIMFDYQVNKLTKEFLEDTYQYMEESWAIENAKVPISQLRTIPIGIDVEYEVNIAHYDSIKRIVESSGGPFMILNCICRQAKDIMGEPCQATSRREVCVIIGYVAQRFIDLGWGRKIDKKETLEILRKSEEEGLVFQTDNSQEGIVVCNCCSCCCAVLSELKKLPNPGENVFSNYYAEVEPDSCTGCGTCVDRCPMNAISLENNVSSVMRKRCIGCGNCIYTCPSEAIKLCKKDKQYIPHATMDELYNENLKKRKKIRKEN